MGFFSSQRTNVKNVELENEEGVTKIEIVLVRESLIHNEKSILFITYCNLYRDNFDAIILKSDHCKFLFYMSKYEARYYKI